MTIYYNSQSANIVLSNNAMNTVLSKSIIGSELAGGQYFNGQMANLQVYNTALDPASVNALYLEGIGGEPLSLQSLAAWWPLNGDTNDYSGNGNSGVPNNVIFSGSWLGGYTVP